MQLLCLINSKKQLPVRINCKKQLFLFIIKINHFDNKKINIKCSTKRS
jgi:hypothetical protein